MSATMRQTVCQSFVSRLRHKRKRAGNPGASWSYCFSLLSTSTSRGERAVP
jgi:hypothetical protein